MSLWKGTFKSNMYPEGFCQGNITLSSEDGVLSSLNKVTATLIYSGLYSNSQTRIITLTRHDGIYVCTDKGQDIKFMLSFIDPTTITGFYSTTGPIDMGMISVSKC